MGFARQSDGTFHCSPTMIPADLISFPQGFRFWVACLYAPTNCHRQTVQAFYAPLDQVHEARLKEQHLYYLGDWNGCLRSHEDQLKVPHRPIRTTNGDTALQSFFHKHSLFYHVQAMDPAFDIIEHFTHESSYQDEVTNTRVHFYRVIDYILTSLCLASLHTQLTHQLTLTFLIKTCPPQYCKAV
jgi:hypothetical protein